MQAEEGAFGCENVIVIVVSYWTQAKGYNTLGLELKAVTP